jgi:hypothetical protein
VFHSIQKPKKPEGDFVARSGLDSIRGNKGIGDTYKLLVALMCPTYLDDIAVVKHKITLFGRGYFMLNLQLVEKESFPQITSVRNLIRESKG